MIKKFVPLDRDVEPSQTPFNIKTFRACDEMLTQIYKDPCSYEPPPKPCVPGKKYLTPSKPIAIEEAIFRWLEMPRKPKFQTSCNKNCQQFEPYTACVMNQRTPGALKHHAVVREKYLKVQTRTKQKVHDGRKGSSSGASLIQMESLLIGKDELRPKIASPACSMETYYVPSRRLVKKRRDRNSLTFYEKVAVIRHHETNKLSRNNLARMFQCCTTQIRKIIDNKDEILARWQAMCESNAPVVIEEMSKKRREFEMRAIAFILHQWVERCRDLQLNMIINDATLKMIATKMATVLNIRDFKPTARWIERFRLKFKYKDENLSNARSTDDPQQGTLSVEDIIIEFKNFLPSFMRQEISNITSNTQVEACTTVSTVEEAVKEADLHNSQDREGSNVSDERDINGNSSVAPESLLEHLSVVQRFLQSNFDHQAMTVVTQLQNYIEQTYIHSQSPSSLPSSSTSPSPSRLHSPSQQTDPDYEDYVILIE